jgi:hypothetical protein
MKRNSNNPRIFCGDPLAIAVACVISLLFASSIQHYISTSKRNVSCTKTETVFAFQCPDDSFPEDRPDAWTVEKSLSNRKFIKTLLPIAVTFDIHRDYTQKLSGYFNRLSQPPAWLPSIPVAHRKLII